MTPPPQPHRPLRRDAQANRDRILAAAPEVLADLGPDAPMDAIARRAGVGIGTLYRRFPTREDLILAIFEAQTEQLARWADEAARDADAWRAFSGFLERAMETPAADQVVRRLISTSAPPDRLAERLLGLLLPSVGRLLARAHQAGVVRRDFAASDIPPLIVGLVAIKRDSAAVAPQAWRRILALFLDGLRPAAATPLPGPPLGEEQLRELIRRAGRPAP